MRMHLVTLTVLLLALCSLGASAPIFVMRGGHEWGMYATEKVLKDFAIPRHMGRAAFDISRWDDTQNIEQFVEAKCDLLIHRGLPNDHEAELLKQRFPEGEAQPQVFVAAYGKVAVVVHAANPLKSLTLEQVRRLLMMKNPTTQWKDLAAGGAIKLYGEKRDDPSRLIIRHACMMLGPKYPTGYYLYRDDFVQCDDGDEVLQKILKDQNAIGFILYHGQKLPPGVKLLAVGATDQGPFVLPAQAPLIQKDYLLAEPLVLYLHPKAPKLAVEFCQFAVSKEGAEIFAKHGFITPHASAQAEAEDRLAQMKAGKGERIEATGGAETTALMRDLATEYTRANAVVQMGYAAAQEPSAVGGFLSNRGLLVSRGPVEEKELSPTVKAKWDALAKPADGSKGISRRCVAGRAAVVVTHSLNKLKSLTPDQVRAIFTGKVRDWKVLAAMGADSTGSEIRCYGPPAADPVSAVFFQRLEFREGARLERSKSGPDVLSTLSMDPQAIGFVNLADLPDEPAKLGLKVVPIGEGGSAVMPTAQTVLDGSYPLADRFYLYVHPKATAIARDFAQFIATPAAAVEVFRKNGLVCAMPPTPGNSTPAAPANAPSQ